MEKKCTNCHQEISEEEHCFSCENNLCVNCTYPLCLKCCVNIYGGTNIVLKLENDFINDELYDKK